MGSYKLDVIDPGDRASKLASDICRASHKNCGAVTIVPHQPDNFRGAIGFSWSPAILQEMIQNSSTDWVLSEEMENDGAGGKPGFFTLLNNPDAFRGLGWEIITMVADDFARSGRFPAVMVNEMNVKAITDGNFHLFQACMEGYGVALQKSGLVNLTGEIAIMKNSITAFCDDGSPRQFILTWGGTCIGLARKELLIDGSKIKPGMPIVGFQENGYRCNGGTFFANLILELDPQFRSLEENPHGDIADLVKGLVIPSKSYARTICRLVGWNIDGTRGKTLANIAGIAHITGGGIWGKFGELLPSGVGAVLTNMPEPPRVLLNAQRMSCSPKCQDMYLSDHQAYDTFHGGCGMLVVCNGAHDAQIVMAEAAKDNIRATVVGTTHSLSTDCTRLGIISRFGEYGRPLNIDEPY